MIFVPYFLSNAVQLYFLQIFLGLISENVPSTRRGEKSGYFATHITRIKGLTKKYVYHLVKSWNTTCKVR